MFLYESVRHALAALIAVNDKLLKPNVACLALVAMVKRLRVCREISNKLARWAVLTPEKLLAICARLGKRLNSATEPTPHRICQLLGKRVV